MKKAIVRFIINRDEGEGVSSYDIPDRLGKEFFFKARDLEISDGYHTFDELYEHRIVLFMKLCELWIQSKPSYDSRNVWASLLHSDDTCFEGWFVLGIGKEKGNQITYHLPMKYWPDVQKFSEVLEKAPEWDGHSPADVLVRIKDLLK